MYRRILVATDGSPAAQHALVHAAGIAQKFNAEIILVHVFRNIEEFGESPYFSELEEGRKQAGETVLGQAMTKLKDSDVTIHVEAAEGHPAEAIVNLARVRNCDLIVMGSRGLGTFKELLMGSVSDKVVRRAPCPVLVVR